MDCLRKKGVLANCINRLIETGYFPDSLKEANITSIFKKDYLLNKFNYRPVSILPLISKLYERLIYNQLPKIFKIVFHVV